MISTLVLDNALAVWFAFEVAEAVIDVALSISPLPLDEPFFKRSFDDCKVLKNYAASSMGLVVLPVALIKA